jgi:hypothetical protein
LIKVYIYYTIRIGGTNHDQTLRPNQGADG